MPLYKQTETNCDLSLSYDCVARFVVKSLLLVISLKSFGLFSQGLLGTSTVDWRVRKFHDDLRDTLLTLSKVDGRSIAEIDEAEVLSYAKTLSEVGITTVVVNGVFSPLDTSTVTQEEEVRRILLKAIPGIDVVCSRDIGRVGYLERENASILNAAILAFGRITISRFQKAVEALGVSCPLYLTQNDGTVLDAYSASLAPIRTFSSGATVSAPPPKPSSTNIHQEFAYWCTFPLRYSRPRLRDRSDQVSGHHGTLHWSSLGRVIDDRQCDIGGTTSDFAALSPSGLPRQSPATVKVGGVRTAFSMPEVLSLGLGGGSKIAQDENFNVKVGPLSVGHLLTSESKCFGGSVLTATDIVVASGASHQVKGSISKLQDLDERLVKLARQDIRKQIEHGIDIMKTSDLPVILLLVGGGSIIVLDQLENVAHCLQPDFSDVANAVGAAIAKISGDIDTIIVPEQTPYEEIKRNISQQAIDIAVRNGAQLNTVEVMEVDLIPLQYMTNGSLRAVAKAVRV
jgi:N-methylhydantoinase A/oxoprolinase/acetone carboxylase beta subunit